MADLMEQARASKTLADTLKSRKDEVALFLDVFYQNMTKEEKRKVLKEIRG